MTGLLWDLDGTLVDSVEDIALAVNGLLVDLGLPTLGADEVRPFVGDGAGKLVDRVVRAAGGEPGPGQLATFRRHYREVPVRHTRVFAGIEALLAAVGAPQAVVTNKPEDITRTILARLGLDAFFPVVVGGETLPTRKPAPEMVWHAMAQLGVDRAVLVGDGPADVGAARAAGIDMIGVGWGIGQPEGAPEILADVPALRRALAARGLLR